MNKIDEDVIEILKAYLKKDYSFNIDNNYNDILKHAEKYCLGQIVGYTLSKEIKQNSFLGAVYQSATRYEKQEDIRKLIINVFEKNNIDFVFIKGSTLGKYYDEPYLRYSGDVDVVVNSDNYNKAHDILIESGFKEYSYTTNELTVELNGVYVDLHCKFTLDNDEVEKQFNSVDFTSSNHELSNEYKYYLVIAHAAKHISINHINLQFLIDLYYVRNLDLNRDTLDDMLIKSNLKTFEQINLNTLDVLFNNSQSSETIDKYIEFLLNYSKAKGLENQALVGQAHKGNKSTNIINRLFPSYEEMQRQNPSLNSKALLPLYYLKRFFDRIKQGQFNRAINEINANMNVDKDKVEETKALLKEIGL